MEGRLLDALSVSFPRQIGGDPHSTFVDTCDVTPYDQSMILHGQHLDFSGERSEANLDLD